MSFYEEVRIAGFGGQGIILAGKLLAQTAMDSGKEVTYMPAYGAEMRGGTANSMIIISDDPIASPIVTNPNSLVAMSKASMIKFSSHLKAGGLLVLNSSLIDSEPDVCDTIKVLAVPADEMAVGLGNVKVANMVALGAYLYCIGALAIDLAAKNLSKVLASRYHKTLPINTEALQIGAQFAEKNQ